MDNLLKIIIKVIGVFGNIFLASTAVFSAIDECKDDPIYSAITVGVIVAMWNVFIFVLSHWDE